MKSGQSLFRYIMRLGSSDLDSVHTTGIERNVKQVLVHPKYRQNQAYYDVGIAVADVHIEFSDYVRPICLPFRPVDDEDDLADDFVTLAGWGYFLDPRNELQLSSKLKLISLQVNFDSYITVQNVLLSGATQRALLHPLTQRKKAKELLTDGINRLIRSLKKRLRGMCQLPFPGRSTIGSFLDFCFL